VITRLTVLYDADCGLCRTARAWLASRAQLVPLEFVAAGSDEARRRYPALDPAETLADITVVADDGGVYSGDSAWIICLWALDGYRGLAARLSRPDLRPTARRMVGAAAALRRARLDSYTPKIGQGYGSDCGGTCDA
jgi:predicted DCC family thiol-disulfide oxidoreductase YuxK